MIAREIVFCKVCGRKLESRMVRDGYNQMSGAKRYKIYNACPKYRKYNPFWNTYNKHTYIYSTVDYEEPTDEWS